MPAICVSLYVTPSFIQVLHLVTHLTFTIINVLKRLFIIVAGMLYTHQQLRPLNTLGVVLAISGA
jgi:hypothetical protein